MSSGDEMMAETLAGLPMVDLVTVDRVLTSTYGLLYESRTAHRVVDGPMASRGPFMLRYPTGLHVVQVWANTCRPYSASAVQPSLRADGYRWVDPLGYPTNDTFTRLIAPRTARPSTVGDKPIGSTIITGSEIMLNYPDGRGWVYAVKTRRYGAPPGLTPIDATIIDPTTG